MPVALLFFQPNYAKIMLKLCSFLQIMLPFSKLCYSKTMANKSKNIFSLIRRPLFLLAIIYKGLWKLWLVLARHFSDRAVRFHSNRPAQLTPFCSPAYKRYWDRHGLPWDFSSRTPQCQASISGLSKGLVKKYRGGGPEQRGGGS